jgi:hypothetical protein
LLRENNLLALWWLISIAAMLTFNNSNTHAYLLFHVLYLVALEHRGHGFTQVLYSPLRQASNASERQHALDLYTLLRQVSSTVR